MHDLPPKIIQDYYCDLSDVQKRLYDEFSKSRAGANAEDAVKTSVKGESGENAGQKHIFQSLQYLRKVCNHPALVMKETPASGWEIKDAPKLQALRYLPTFRIRQCALADVSSLDNY